MKNKFLFSTVVFVAAAIFAVGLASCASGGQASGAGGSGNAGAAKLAADINAFKAGSAAASGDKVTLSSDVTITASLAVPAGVTLDLTKASLRLGDGAVFTVDGAVDAKNEGVKVESAAASPSIINGSGVIRLQSKGNLLKIERGKQLTLDGVTLVGIKDNNESLVRVGEGGDLTLKSGAITGNIRQGSGGSGLRVWGTFTMEGGEISGNSATGESVDGGGLRVDSNGVFTMKGGKITGNSVTGSNSARGGGVSTRPGVFNMLGGEISGNSAIGKRAEGGGVSANLFTMQGGTISGNSAQGNESYGGGVFIPSYDGAGAFALQGGTIYGSAAIANAGVNANETKDANGAPTKGGGASLATLFDTMNAKWGTGGTYTKGGISQKGGNIITDGRVAWEEGFRGTTDATLVATPAQ